MRMLDLVGPVTSTLLTPGIEQNASIALAASGATATRSMSPMVSLPRRRLPANSIALTTPVTRRCAMADSATANA